MNKILPSLLLGLCLLSACTDLPTQSEDQFFVENQGAIMPVYLRGDLTADALILFLHGGPGGNAAQATFIPAFQELESHYAMAYWDQRASGLSQGNPDPSTFTVEQFVQDTHAVVQALQARYPGKALFLLGHSWGGALGAAYLSTGDQQANIAGWICMNSGHNLLQGLPLSVDWVQAYAQAQLDAGTEVEYWTAVRDWCAADPDMTVAENYFEYVGYLRQTDAYHHDNQPVVIDPVTLGDVLNSRLNLGIMLGGAYLSRNFNILELNLSPAMATITRPSLVLWGRHDGVNTLDMGYDAFNSLGTPEASKEMVILENSAHEGFLEEPTAFRDAVLDFVDRYK